MKVIERVRGAKNDFRVKLIGGQESLMNRNLKATNERYKFTD